MKLHRLRYEIKGLNVLKLLYVQSVIESNHCLALTPTINTHPNPLSYVNALQRLYTDTMNYIISEFK